MKKSKSKKSAVLLVCIFIIGIVLFWSHQNVATSFKNEPTQITAMDIVKMYSGEMGKKPGPVTYSDELSGEDFARLAVGSTFWRLPWGTKVGQYSPDLPHYTLRIQCGEVEYSGQITPDGKYLRINGENIRVFGNLLEQIMALNFAKDSGTVLLGSQR